VQSFIPQAFPTGTTLILDAEILLVDTSGKPLPFGTLGVHKKAAFKDATVCLFVFDILHLNGAARLNWLLDWLAALARMVASVSFLSLMLAVALHSQGKIS